MKRVVKRFASLLSVGLCSTFLMSSQGYGFLTDLLDKANRVINESERLRQSVENLMRKGGGNQNQGVQGEAGSVGKGSDLIHNRTQPIVHSSGKIIFYFLPSYVFPPRPRMFLPAFYWLMYFTQFDSQIVFRFSDRPCENNYIYNLRTNDITILNFCKDSPLWENVIRKKYYMYNVNELRDNHISFHNPRVYILLPDALIAGDDLIKDTKVLLDKKQAEEMLRKYYKSVEMLWFTHIKESFYHNVLYVFAVLKHHDTKERKSEPPEYAIFVTTDNGKTWEVFFHPSRSNYPDYPNYPVFVKYGVSPQDPYVFYGVYVPKEGKNVFRETVILDKKTRMVRYIREEVPGTLELYRKYNIGLSNSYILLYHDVTGRYIFKSSSRYPKFVGYDPRTKEEWVFSLSFDPSVKRVFSSKDGSTIVINVLDKPTITHETSTSSFVSFDGGKTFSFFRGFYCMPVENRDHKVTCIYEGTIDHYYTEIEERRKRNMKEE